MNEDGHKKIGSASYLNKNNELYIPFEVQTPGTYYNLIQPMLD